MQEEETIYLSLKVPNTMFVKKNYKISIIS